MNLRVINNDAKRVEVFSMSMNLMPVSKGFATIVKHIRDSLYMLHFDGQPAPEERAIHYVEGEGTALLL